MDDKGKSNILWELQLQSSLSVSKDKGDKQLRLLGQLKINHYM